MIFSLRGPTLDIANAFEKPPAAPGLRQSGAKASRAQAMAPPRAD